MLIRAGQKPRIKPLHPVIPHLRIREKRCRRRSDVRYGVDIIDRCGDVRSHGEFLRLCGDAARFFKRVMAATRATGAEPLSHRLVRLSGSTASLPPGWCCSLDPQNRSLRTSTTASMSQLIHTLDTLLVHPCGRMVASSRTDYGRTCT